MEKLAKPHFGGRCFGERFHEPFSQVLDKKDTPGQQHDYSQDATEPTQQRRFFLGRVHIGSPQESLSGGGSTLIFWLGGWACRPRGERERQVLGVEREELQNLIHVRA